MKDDLNNSTAMVAYLPDFPGLGVYGRPPTPFRGMHYTFSWYSQQDLPLGLWDQREAHKNGWWRYSRGVDDNAALLMRSGRWRDAAAALGFLSVTFPLYNPSLVGTSAKPTSPYIETAQCLPNVEPQHTNRLTHSYFTNGHWSKAPRR